MVSDTVHLVEDLLPLTFDLHTQLAARFVKLADHLRERLLTMYANPVINKERALAEE